jgi:hypothetical protein
MINLRIVESLDEMADAGFSIRLGLRLSLRIGSTVNDGYN